jgi:hypothetical protein
MQVARHYAGSLHVQQEQGATSDNRDKQEKSLLWPAKAAASYVPA